MSKIGTCDSCDKKGVLLTVIHLYSHGWGHGREVDDYFEFCKDCAEEHEKAWVSPYVDHHIIGG